MKTFALQLYDSSHQQRITEVTDFVGEDATGSFGIRANHARFMTLLTFGLARFRPAAGNWQYLALPGAVLFFDNDELTISSRHFMIDADLDRISTLLEQQLIAEEEGWRAAKTSLHKMEQAMLTRLWNLKQKTAR